MKKGTLTRTETGDEGTYGELELEGGFKCVTLELPWRSNVRKLSCAPAGRFLFKKVTSPTRGEVYQEYDDPNTPAREDVPDRDCIQIHAANLAGDVEKGYVSQLLGCIAPGLSVAQFKKGNKPAGDRDQQGVSASRAALVRLEEALKGELLDLEIRWAAGVGPKETT